MLGILRFLLAACVVIGHLTEGINALSNWGIFAVFGFYVVSGYLMTLVLNETYAFRFAPYAQNRFLRLYPLYYVVAAATALAIAVGRDASSYLAPWSPGTEWTDLAGNLLIVPFAFYDARFRLVTPSWSIGVEIINYVLLWAVVARSRRAAWVACALALAFHLGSLAAGGAWTNRYAPWYAALLPFALGALLYFHRDSIAAIRPATIRGVALLAGAAWGANLVACGMTEGIWGPRFSLFFYVNLACLVALVAALSAPALRSGMRRTGKALGDLAYPIFLCHWLVGFVVGQLALGGQRRGLPLLAASALPILLAAYLLARLGDRWVEPARARIRDAVSHPATTRAGTPIDRATEPTTTG